MSVRETLAAVRSDLAAVGVEDAALEAEVLLMRATGLDRVHLIADAHDEVSQDAQKRLRPLVDRRVSREPLAYITGTREFYGLDFVVDSRVLVPRQETETLVEVALDLLRRNEQQEPWHIVDVGTGSGAIAVSLAVELPDAYITAIDRSKDALSLAALNAQRHGVERRVRCVHGDLLDEAPDDFDLLVANLPYVSNVEWESLQPEIRLFEPKDALVPGETGLEAVTRLLTALARRCSMPRWAVLELGAGQAPAMAAVAERLLPGATVETYRDLAGLERGLTLTLPTTH
ncbi:MAG: peptide chain release factor N(5)-glutamine methyltransferase [Chloroflexi bacterium]|nr:peptide chain release factor N(5)-glutamine methyltransferase [Chloroflexota bacterium]